MSCARPPLQRDVQMRKCYAWEKLAYRPGGKVLPSLHAHDVRKLVLRVHDDVRDAGGFAEEYPKVEFTKRNGLAHGRWGAVNFTRGDTSIDTVLHEVAHALTWYPDGYRRAHWIVREALSAGRTTALLTPLQQHLLRYGCPQGHGPKYVACYIALMERYAGFSAPEAVAKARDFEVPCWGPWQTVQKPFMRADGTSGTWTTKLRSGAKRRTRLAIDAAALTYWRQLLFVDPPFAY